PLQPEQPFP
nr:Chain C, peptide PRO-LEU-GLN-PRO-GLU-GLN-PRO-PHE-PRO [Triticum aestivum]5IFJ_F Chain F, peptide PRO-LEU-GLN-PRO-GLU-GLN-PRO-PHE-PRO [Triticum aestivum]5IFJ_I Chain I, peptide PRO-LEU-GLN-PRO-GLU-GLN-PRO-PHE-PRO [Triticum aestivum]5IFJ_L Chain L, peptide PRO-LEU-GLN-PRO-GLU-GLN-PRO-PHE-PRO [Triticum aestivum]5IJK_X Chain X, peptide PRO-LEU-GLN-PRO-GLU-GLN-PRO-PHE-PRO [Triticum aestivum]5IJK_Y Chain Y, peptide PRO-LEU-GLN-PRO-GLU-GLN-PRO-PHE-PRO [Triticum aestivum]